MMFKSLWRSLLFLLVFFPCVQMVNGQEQAEIKTNESFLRESIQELLGETFADFPRDLSRLIFVHSDSDNSAAWLVDQELTSYLTSRGFEAALPRPELESERPGDSWDLGYRIIELRLGYPEAKRKGLFGKKLVTREASLNLSFRLTDRDTGKILWTKRKNHGSTDQIPENKIHTLENQEYAFLSPVKPQGAISKYVEPALVAAVVGGLVYLFFASR